MEKEEIQYWSKKYDEQHPWWIRKEKELGDKLRRLKELTKDDLVQMTEWKFKITPLILPRRLRDVAKNDDAEIRRISRHVFSLSPKDDSDRINSLDKLNGVGPAVATVVLTIYDPKQYGVFDKHVWRELFGKEPKYLYTTENVLEVLSELRRIANKYGLDVRTVEKAFFKKNFDEVKTKTRTCMHAC